TYTYAEQVKYTAGPGNVTFNIPIPKKLPYLTNGPSDVPMLNVTVYVGGTKIGEKVVKVYPVIEVSPITTTVVDPVTGEGVNIKVYGYGYSKDTELKPVLNGYKVDATGTALHDGSVEITFNLKDDTTGKGIPRGVYNVNLTADGATGSFLNETKTAKLEVKPVVVVTPNEGHGKDTEEVTITGYGFSANANITRVEFVNTNFTNVVYSFPVGETTDEYGFFEKTISFGRNMSAGLYILRTYEAPVTKTLSEPKTIQPGTKDTVAIPTDSVEAKLRTKANATAEFYVEGGWEYVPERTAISYTVGETLRITFTHNGYNYMITAMRVNAIDPASEVMFALYNVTGPIPVQMANVTKTPSWNDTFNAYVAEVSFNITDWGPGKWDIVDGPSEYKAVFYSYATYIMLELQVQKFVINYANLTLKYTNVDTGVTRTWFYLYNKTAGVNNFTRVDTVIEAVTPKFTDADIEWSLSFKWNAMDYSATLELTGKPLKEIMDEFRAVPYLVRPLLEIVSPVGVIRPGDNVTIAAYGYGPGAEWGYPGKNSLTVTFDDVVLLGEFPLGKDGNATFSVTIPKDATFGAHYIWGRDLWGYEYSLAVIIGAKAYWAKIVAGVVVPEYEVSAGYGDKRLEVCPCPEIVVGKSYCDVCVVYAGDCDYLGDYVEVVVTGLVPGERVTVYVAGKNVISGIADSSGLFKGVFVVPTLPEGDYSITVVASISGYIVPMWFNGTHFIDQFISVKPKILLLALEGNYAPVLVGSGIVRVIGTGFTPGVSITGVLINGTDALMSVTTNVLRWSADSNGVLKSDVTDVLGLWIPMLQPGKYAVSLTYIKGVESSKTLAGYVFVVNNLSYVVTADDISDVKNAVNNAADRLSEKLDTVSKAVGDVKTAVSDVLTKLGNLADKTDLDSAVERILDETRTLWAGVATKSDVNTLLTAIRDVEKAVEDVKTAVGKIQLTVDLSPVLNAVNNVRSLVEGLSGKLDTVSSKVDAVSGKVDALSGRLGDVVSAINNVGGKVDTVSSKVDAVSGRVDALSGKVDTVSSKVDTVSGKVDATSSRAAEAAGTASTALYLGVITLIFALLATVFALLAYMTVKKSIAAPK
ncbi:MAG: hypothetical protein QW249_05635, partial [Desulfurococcaceae archaeon]